MNRSRITGDLTASGLLYADIANDRVGIGSTIPGNKLSLPDSAKIGLGNAEDLTLHHTSDNSFIVNTTGNLTLNSNIIHLKDGGNNKSYLRTYTNDRVEIFFNNTVRFATNSAGVTVSGNCNVQGGGITMQDTYGYYAGTSNDLSILHNATNSVIKNITGDLEFQEHTSSGNIIFKTTTSGTERLRITKDGALEGQTSYAVVGINTFAKFTRTGGGGPHLEIGYNAVTTDYGYFGTGTAHGLGLRTNDTTALFIDTNQKVGIGTASPDRIIHAYESTDNNLLFLESGDTNVDIIQADTGGSTRIRNSQGSLVFYVNGDASSSSAANAVTGLTIDGDKDVHVYDDLFIPDKIIHEGDTNTAIRFPSADIITTETGGTERTRVSELGLRIGTNSVTANVAGDDLTIEGASDRGLSIISGSSSSGNIYFGDSSDADIGRVMYNHNDNALQIYTNASASPNVTIDSGGRVGIGTVPVAGEGAELSIRSSDGQTNVGLIPNTNSQSSQFTFYNAANDSAQGYIRYDNSSNSLQLRVNLAERLRISSNGRVSVGNLASPDGNLHVYNSSAGSVTAASDANELVLESAANVGMSFLTANDSLARIKFGDPDATNAGIIIYSHADDSLRFQHTSTERFRIDSTGRVLIGSTSADDTSQKLKLHQAGNDHCLLNLNVSNSSYSSLINFGDSGSWSIGQIAYAHSDDSLRFKVNAAERLRITSTGKVGIGTDQTTSTLQIYGANDGEGTATGQLTLKDTAAYNASPTAGVVFQGHHASNNAQAIFAGIRGFKANTGDGDYDGCLAFDVRKHGAVAYEAMRINEDGKVGINSTSPTYALEVDGGTQNTVIVARSSDTRSQISFIDNATTGYGHVAVGCEGNDLFIRTGSGSKALTIKSDGKIGVGIDAPVGNLEVRDTKANLIVAKDGLTVKGNSDLHTTYDIIQLGAGAALASYSTATVTADTHLVHNAYRHSGGAWQYRYADTAMRLRMNSPGGAFIFDSAASGSAGATVSFSEKLRIDSSGNIGMGGNTNPTNVLHIKTSVNNTAVATIESTATDSYPFLRLKNDAREYQLTCHGPLSDVFTIYDGTAGAHRLTITSGGNVGINDSNPDNQLVVKSPSGHTTAKVTSGDATTTMVMQAIQGSEGRLGMSSNHPLAIYAGGLEKLRIASDGKATFTNKVQVTSLGVGTVPDDHMGLHILQANPRILIKSSGTNAAKIFFGDSSSTDPGVIEYSHSANTMYFGTNNNGNRLAIDSSGRISFFGLDPANYYATYDDFVWGRTSGSVGMTIVSGSDSAGYITWADGTSSADQYRGRLFYNHGDNSFNFRCNGLSNDVLKINSSQVYVTGTGDGVLNLDTSHSSGAFIRFKQGGTTKNWIGCATGIGGYGDNDDLTLLATDNLILATNSAKRVTINSAGKVKIGGGSATLALLHIAPADYSLNLQNNSSNESKILFTKNTNDGDARAWIKGNGELNGYLKFGAGDADRLHITSAGYVNRPNQPAFRASGTLSFTDWNSYEYCTWGTENYDNAGAWNGYSFTCPTGAAGDYLFQVEFLAPAAADNGNENYILFALFIGTSGQNLWRQDWASGTNKMASFSGMVLQLAVGDVVRVAFHKSYGRPYVSGYTTISGCKIN